MNELMRLPLAAGISLALVALGAVLTTAPATAGLWVSDAIAAVALFVAIVYSGTALRIRRRHRR